MEIIEVNLKEFTNVTAEPYHVFGSGAFTHLNTDKADSIHYLLFKKGKYRLGLTAGIRNNTLLSPFSAPFGGFVYLSDDVRIGMIDEAITLLLEWAKKIKLEFVKITVPPTIYNEKFISKQVNCLYRTGFSIENIDLNYSFSLGKFNDEYPANIWRNARKNLKIALKNDLSFIKCETLENKKLAYEVIRQNREAREFPLRMSWEQVRSTTELIPADFFLVKDEMQKAIAAAVVFRVSKDICQVVYWGDLPETSHLKTMNYLSFKVFEFYANEGLQIVDIGPSTEDSIPNAGLCEFKESIGCDINLKYTFIIAL